MIHDQTCINGQRVGTCHIITIILYFSKSKHTEKSKIKRKESSKSLEKGREEWEEHSNVSSRGM